MKPVELTIVVIATGILAVVIVYLGIKKIRSSINKSSKSIYMQSQNNQNKYRLSTNTRARNFRQRAKSNMNINRNSPSNNRENNVALRGAATTRSSLRYEVNHNEGKFTDTEREDSQELFDFNAGSQSIV